MGLLIAQTPLADKFLHEALVPVNTYQHTTCQHSISFSFRDREGVLKFNVGLLAPCRTLYAETFVCDLSTCKIKQFAKFQHRSSNYSVFVCEYVFAI